MHVLGDRRGLLQSWRELLRIAAEAAIQGSKNPAVTVELIHAGEDAAVLLHDDGPPLSAADQEALLDSTLGMINEGGRADLLRAHRALLAQGGHIGVLPSRLGGTSLRVVIPKAPRSLRHAA